MFRADLVIRCKDESVRLDNREWRFSRRSLAVVAGKVF
jgi:hypothetical protein